MALKARDRALYTRDTGGGEGEGEGIGEDCARSRLTACAPSNRLMTYVAVTEKTCHYNVYSGSDTVMLS